jgi:hypothetical protein
MNIKLQQQAINKQIEIGGKLFCIHDYIYLSEKLALYACKHIYGCIKCGKTKESECMLLEPLNHYQEYANF